MSAISCTAVTSTHCAIDRRRAIAEADGRLCGLDEVEVDADGVTLRAHFFGPLPTDLDERHVRVDGGDRIRVRVLSVTADPDDPACLVVVVDRRGDFSSYCLCLVDPGPDEAGDPAVATAPPDAHASRGAAGTIARVCGHDPLPTDPLVLRVPAGVDPRYACASFGFRIDCPAPDCRPTPCAPARARPAPAIDYLARDYPTFRSLLLDRLATTMPGWDERHVPDLMLTLVELLAYRADQLSYELDAVATEAYLATARRRISVRRHARLLDYRLHEGCNARTWLTLDSDSDIDLDLDDLVFAAPPPDAVDAAPGTIDWLDLRERRGALLYEAMPLPGTFDVVLDTVGATISPRRVMHVRAAHSTIAFHTWGFASCCLPAGTTRATLRDQAAVSEVPVPPPDPGSPRDASPGDRAAPTVGTGRGAQPTRALDLSPGQYLVLEETRGAVTGSPADADRTHRHVVRLTRVERTVDPLDGTLLLEVAWDACDALPFALCLSSRTGPPDCEEIVVAVVHGNLLLVDHGARVDERDEWTVAVERDVAYCACDGEVVDHVSIASALRFTLQGMSITHAAPCVSVDAMHGCASDVCRQDPRQALPQVRLDVGVPDRFDAHDPHQVVWNDRYDWRARFDLLDEDAAARAFVAEIDDDGRAHVRFGDGRHGARPEAGCRFNARYRVGNGSVGNVGADAIVWMASRTQTWTGLGLRPRNPLASSGGVDPEPIDDARLYAPHAYGRVLERAVRADDYAEIALADSRIEGAKARLAWTGAWYEATVALDPYAAAADDATLAGATLRTLDGVRRIGHDLRIVPARRVPLRIALDVCVTPGYAQSDVVTAIADALSNRVLGDGTLGLFHDDRLTFGTDVTASRVIAAVQRVAGVAHAELTVFERLGGEPGSTRSLQDGLIAIRPDEIAQLDADPDFPERGSLALNARGGR